MPKDFGQKMELKQVLAQFFLCTVTTELKKHHLTMSQELVDHAENYKNFHTASLEVMRT
jgi:hypothetical protein